MGELIKLKQEVTPVTALSSETLQIPDGVYSSDQPDASGAAPQPPDTPHFPHWEAAYALHKRENILMGEAVERIVATLAAPATGKLRTGLDEIITHAKSKTPCASHYQCLLADLMGLRAALAAADEEGGARLSRDVIAIKCKDWVERSHNYVHNFSEKEPETLTDFVMSLLAAAPPPREREAGKEKL